MAGQPSFLAYDPNAPVVAPPTTQDQLAAAWAERNAPMMSVAPQQKVDPLVSTESPPPPPNFTPAPPQAEQTVYSPWLNPGVEPPQMAQPQPVGGEPSPPPQTGPTTLELLTNLYGRGTQRVVPEGIRKVGEQWQQRNQTGLPGDVSYPLPNQPLPERDNPTSEQMGSPLMSKGKPLTNASGEELYRNGGRVETQTQRFDRLAFENAQRREPVVQPSQYDQAKSALEETENEALLDKRLQLQQEADAYANAARLEYLRGRGEAERVIQAKEEQAQRQALIDDHLKRMQTVIEQRSQLSAVNPSEEYWRKMTGFDKVRMALAMGLGSMGRTLNGIGAPPVALSIIQQGIEGEAAKQRAAIDMFGQEINARRSLLGDMLQHFKSPDAAQRGLEAALTGLAESAFRREALKTKEAEKQAQITGLADALALQRDEKAKQALEAEHTYVTAWQPARVVGQQGGLAGYHRLLKDLGYKEGTPAFVEAMSKLTTEGPKVFAEWSRDAAGQRLPTGRGEVEAAKFQMNRKVQIPEIFGGGEAQTTRESATKEIQEGLNSADEIARNIDRIQKLVVSGSIVSATDRAMVAQIGASMMGPWRVRLGLGVMSESDKELVKPLTGQFVNDFVSRATSDQLKILGNVRSLVEQGVDISMNQLKSDVMATKPYRPQMRSKAVK